MKKYLLALCALLIIGCDEQETVRQPFKTTYADIQKNFSENVPAANLLYKNKYVELTDTVNSVKGGGTVILVTDAMEPYMVGIESGSRKALASLKPGDTLTIRCAEIDAAMIGSCAVVR
jgi:hypothetical protein